MNEVRFNRKSERNIRARSPRYFSASALALLSCFAFLGFFGIAFNAAGQPGTLADIESRARANLRDGRFKEAEQEFSRALRIDSRRAALWEGRAYAAIGQALVPTFDLRRLDRVPDYLMGDPASKKKRQDADGYARQAYDNARDDGARVAALFLMGLVREPGPHASVLDAASAPVKPYLDAASLLHTWRATKEYAAASDSSSPASRDYILPWSGLPPSQTRPAGPLTTYEEAVDAAVIRALGRFQEAERRAMLERVFRDQAQIEKYLKGSK